MICFGCLYFGFRKLRKYCLYPKHVQAIHELPLQQSRTKCNDFIEWDIKVAPGQVATWPRPVRMEEIR